jgi:hypothetical protein
VIALSIHPFSRRLPNRLVGVQKNGASIATYTYDGDGRQVKTVENGKTTYYPTANFEYAAADTLQLQVRSNGVAGNGYVYRIFDSVTTHTIQTGDMLEFDVWMDAANPQFIGGFDETGGVRCGLLLG